MSISIGMNQAKQLLEKGMGQAEELIREPSKIDELLLQLENYLKEVPVIGETVADLPLMVSMIKGYITKSYTQVSPKVIAALLAAIIYLVKKGDLIPDNMPAIGKADDLAVLTFALKMCEPELKEFAAWREAQMGRFSGGQEEDPQEAKEQEAGWQEPEKRENAEGIEKVYNFLNDAQTYYLATVDGTKPRVRPFGTILLYDGKLYIQTGKVTYTNAGHNPPYVVKADGSVKKLPISHNIIAGVIEGFQYLEDSLWLEHGDTLLLFTDGVTEAVNADVKEYGEARLVAQLKKCSKIGCQQMIDTIKADVDAFVGDAEQSDDITLLAIKRL